MQLSEPQVRTLAKKCGWEFIKEFPYFPITGKPVVVFDTPFFGAALYMKGASVIPLNDESGQLLNVLLTSKGWEKPWILYVSNDGIWHVEKDDCIVPDDQPQGPSPTSAVMAAIIGE